MDLNCPKCQSSNTQKNTSIVRSGTTHGTATTTATSVSRTNQLHSVRTDSVTQATTNSTHQTSLAAALTPQKRYEGVWFLTLAGGISGGFLVSSVVGWLGSMILPRMLDWMLTIIVPAAFFGTIYYAYTMVKAISDKNKHYNKTTYLDELHQYENGYYCHRCEHQFIV